VHTMFVEDRMVRLRSFVYLVVLIIAATTAMAQDLPDGDPRNPSFRNYFTKVVAENPKISDFNKMSVGTRYELPDGTGDYLGEGDKNGIWGREFAKWYGISYGDFLDGKK